MFTNYASRPGLFGCRQSAEANYITGRSKYPTGEVCSSPRSTEAVFKPHRAWRHAAQPEVSLESAGEKCSSTHSTAFANLSGVKHSAGATSASAADLPISQGCALQPAGDSRTLDNGGPHRLHTGPVSLNINVYVIMFRLRTGHWTRGNWCKRRGTECKL